MSEKFGLRLNQRFTHHQVPEESGESMATIRAAGLQFAELLSSLCPTSPELSLAVNHVDDAVTKANQAIARH